MHRWTVLALAVAVALSGCAADEGGADAPPVGDATGGNRTADAPSHDADPAPRAANAPPVASFEADVLNGTVPFDVTFTISGSDPDSDDLTWDVTGSNGSIGNGVDLPAELVIAINVAGNHTFVLSVSDGNSTVTHNLTVAAHAAQEAEVPFEPVSLSQDVLLSCPHCLSSDGTDETGCIGRQTDENGLDCAWFELDPAWAGRTWTVTGMFLPLVEFYPDCGGQGRLAVNVDGTGTIPEGAGCLFAFDPVDPLVTAVLKVA